MLHLLLKILHLLLEIPHFLRMMRVHLRLRILVDQRLYSVAIWWICVILHPSIVVSLASIAAPLTFLLEMDLSSCELEVS